MYGDHEAIQELSYTTEEGRLTIARADLSLEKGDVDSAIDTLNEIRPGQPYYFQAHSKMAHIYLKEKMDRAMFTSCFKEIVSNHPMADAHTMMGDAFMSIHGNPTDTQLIKKLGTSLVQMHEYDKAAQHYESAIRALNDDELRFQYLELLVKLKQYDKVDSIISSELNQLHNKDKDIGTLKRRVRFLLIQTRSRELKNPTAGNTHLILAEARDLQSAVVKRIEIGTNPDHYSSNNAERCEQTCAVLLSTDPGNESAAVMMADLAFRKVPILITTLQITLRDASRRALCSSAPTPAKRVRGRHDGGSGVQEEMRADVRRAVERQPRQRVRGRHYGGSGVQEGTNPDHYSSSNAERCDQTCAVLLSTDPGNESAAVMMADLAFRKVQTLITNLIITLRDASRRALCSSAPTPATSPRPS
ncbi:Tetratricopeptide repeat domain 21B [Operophtera brumata]|uniref:Tetratricopeptide repeat domain 21B n=1 Tax=Operophtera brumata TaxID=104452 RepID=A0A0L7L2Z1_OPEBR|nr:Tetratricopeptide repeat domain 21B [Operophtera brumata]